MGYRLHKPQAIVRRRHGADIMLWARGRIGKMTAGSRAHVPWLCELEWGRDKVTRYVELLLRLYVKL